MALVRERRLPHLNLTVELPVPAAADCRLRFPVSPQRCSTSYAATDDAEFRLSEFEKLQVLGHGNGGTVYKVRHRLTAAVYALKVVHTDASLRRQVYREVDILRRAAGSDRVVRFHGMAPTPSGDVALLLEHMDGGSLDTLLRHRGCRPFPEPALAAVARQALLGLADLHSRQIVHRDIKPANLLINAAGEVKIADFGVGKVLRRSLDPCDSYVGTCAYMSPERFDSESYGGDYDPLAVRMRRSHRQRKDLIASDEKEATSHLRCLTREYNNRSESSRESNVKSLGSPFSSPSSSFSLGNTISILNNNETKITSIDSTT